MDSSDEENVIIGAASIVVLMLEESAKKKLPSVHVNPYLADRKQKGRFAVDFQDMRQNPNVFYENCHMNVEEFDALFSLLEPQLLPKVRSRPHDEITPKEKLAIVLEYFASGSIQRHMASIYRISKQHFGKILDDVCSAIIVRLQEEVPQLNKEKFISLANEFNEKWNLPNCMGAIDGKHVALKCPPNSGSLFYNYKEFHSIVLMAVADANHKFIYLDVGAHGSEGDSGIFSECKFGRAVANNSMDFPEDATLGNEKIPFYFVADDAFPLHTRIMKPYVPRKQSPLKDEERIFNYRLSRARRVVENSFGILCSKWLCLKRTMFCGPDRAQKIIMACCILHNYLLNRNAKNYAPMSNADLFRDGELVEGAWRKRITEESMFSTQVTFNAGRQNTEAKNVREKLKLYVNPTIGSLPWQREAVFLEK